MKKYIFAVRPGSLTCHGHKINLINGNCILMLDFEHSRNQKQCSGLF